MQQDRKSRGHNIQCLFAAMCQLESALLTVKEIRAQAQAMYRKAIAAALHFERVFAVCVVVSGELTEASYVFIFAILF